MTPPAADALHDLNVLVDVAKRLGETFDLDSLLETIAQAGRTALDCERATVFLYDPQRDELYSKVATGTGEIRFPTARGIAGEVVKTRSIVLVNDAYADSRFNPDVDRDTGFRTRDMLTLPLIAPDGEVVGVLQLLNKIGGHFGEHDQLIAGALGSLTGVAIKRQMLLDAAEIKHRLERDLNIARDIQQRLLPQKAPEVKGYEIAGWNLPADQTGGDAYDYFQLADGRIGLMIADATGHGIGPALIVSQCRSVLRAIANEHESPAGLVSRLNDLLCDDLPSDRFVTLCFGVLDPQGHRVDYVSGGHGPQIHFQAASGEAMLSGATGLPLGILRGMDMEAVAPVDLAPGDLFVMITDGFLEWTDPEGRQYGHERLVDLLRGHGNITCAELIQAIYRDVLAFAGGTPQSDDLTVLLVRRDRDCV